MNYLPYGGSTYSKTVVADPIFERRATHGDGWRTFDDQGNDYADLIMGLGSVILGHRHPVVDEAIRCQLSCGTTFSLATDVEREAATRLLKYFSDDCMVQWGVNGSDATEGACRLARLVTGRNQIVMATDGYHGFHDWCLVATERGNGIPAKPTHLWRFSNLAWTTENGVHGKDVAAVIVEPDLHPEWLKDIRQWCNNHGALLIADEVLCFGRFPSFLASAHFGVSPDLWCLGKALANGMPVSAIVGDKSILCRFAPGKDHNAFFSSTWAGHPLSMAAVIATLDVLEREKGPQKLWDLASELPRLIFNQALTERDSLDRALWIKRLGIPPFNRVTFDNQRMAHAWRQLMAEHGVLIYSAHNLSLAHDQNAIHRLLEAWENSVRLLPERLDAIPDSTIENTLMRR